MQQRANRDDMFGEDLSAIPSTEMDDMFGEDLSATPTENLDDMFGEDLSATTTEALELSESGLFASDDMNADWDMSSMPAAEPKWTICSVRICLQLPANYRRLLRLRICHANTEAEMDDMFGEDLSAIPAEMGRYVR
jgi:hypothetical protein